MTGGFPPNQFRGTSIDEGELCDVAVKVGIGSEALPVQEDQARALLSLEPRLRSSAPITELKPTAWKALAPSGTQVARCNDSRSGGESIELCSNMGALLHSWNQCNMTATVLEMGRYRAQTAPPGA